MVYLSFPDEGHGLAKRANRIQGYTAIADFLDKNVVKWFVRPYFSAGWATMRFVNRTASFQDLLLRPDFYVFGTAASALDIGALVEDLAKKLSLQKSAKS